MSENYSDPELDNNLLSILNQESMHSQPGPNQPNLVASLGSLMNAATKKMINTVPNYAFPLYSQISNTEGLIEIPNIYPEGVYKIITEFSKTNSNLRFKLFKTELKLNHLKEMQSNNIIPINIITKFKRVTEVLKDDSERNQFLIIKQNEEINETESNKMTLESLLTETAIMITFNNLLNTSYKTFNWKFDKNLLTKAAINHSTLIAQRKTMSLMDSLKNKEIKRSKFNELRKKQEELNEPALLTKKTLNALQKKIESLEIQVKKQKKSEGPRNGKKITPQKLKKPTSKKENLQKEKNSKVTLNKEKKSANGRKSKTSKNSKA
jgi:hypothetical protein